MCRRVYTYIRSGQLCRAAWLYKGERRRANGREEESRSETMVGGSSGARSHAALCSDGVEHTNGRLSRPSVRPSVGCWVGWLVGRSVARSSSVGLSVGSACVHIALAPCNARGVGPRSRWSSLSDTRLLPASLSLSHRSRLGRSRARV